MGERWTALDLVEGFHLAHAVAALHEEGLLSLLSSGMTPEAVARDGLDVEWVRVLLEYVAARTDLVEKTAAGFRATERYDNAARFLLDQYVGAYGPNARRLRGLLRDPGDAARVVDRQRHAQAYARLGRPGLGLLVDVIAQLGLQHVLDLGCGPGALLLGLARRSVEFQGWGVDASAAMCDVARRRLRVAGIDERVSIIQGDCADLAAAVPVHVRQKVETISAASLMNELFGAGAGVDVAVDWLRSLRQLFPGRALLVADYYGQVGRHEPPWPRLNALHDLVQVISGQGVPPGDRAAWCDMYATAGCTLVHAIEDEGPTFFIHILRL